MLNYKVTAAISDGVDSPFTSPVNASGPTATDGTEFSAELLTQIWGAFQAFLAASGFAPSGTADKADISEILDAIVEQAQGRAVFVKESGGSAANAYVVEANTSLTPQGTSTGVNGKAHSYFAGMVLIFDIVAPNTTTSTVNAFGLGTEFIKTPDGNNVVAGDLSGRLVLRYDGTNFIVLESGGISVFDDIKATGGIVPGVAPSTPLANTLYRENFARAWINFNGTGTIAIRDSFNVASITDNGVGNYTVTWDTDFADVNYAPTTGAENGAIVGIANAPLVGSIQIFSFNSSTNAAIDSNIVFVAAMGDQ